jgi:hypothetical protein
LKKELKMELVCHDRFGIDENKDGGCDVRVWRRREGEEKSDVVVNTRVLAQHTHTPKIPRTSKLHISRYVYLYIHVSEP